MPEKSYDVRVTPNVRFGSARIHISGEHGTPATRDLWMDVYSPVDETSQAPRPAVVLAFGGAYHRGSKENDSFEDGEWRNTAIADYCRDFASRGYVCFSIGYRLTSEDPDPGPIRILSEPGNLTRARVDVVRKMLGLKPATDQMVANGVEAAVVDFATGFRFVHENARAFGVDPSRMVAGGFSAGAVSALYAAFALGIPAAGLVVISGRLEAPDIQRYMRDTSQPPILQFVAENDLEHISRLTAAMRARSAEVGIEHSLFRVLRAGHFYPRNAEAIGPDGERTTVEAEMLKFLSRF